MFSIYCFLLGLTVVYQLFYKSRVYGALVSRLLRYSFGDHYYVHVGALNFSLLGGYVRRQRRGCALPLAAHH